MESRFNPVLVIFSIVVAILASYAALNLAHSLTHASGRARAIWLSCGALAMGIGIWSMHFVGMLAFEMPGMTMSYDIPLLILSIVVAVGASALALHVVSQPIVSQSSIVSGGVAMAAGIAGMHYIGMYSMRMDAVIKWNLFLVALSVIIALVASLAALKILVSLRDKSERTTQMLLASTVLGLAIAGMHYVGMIAATFIHVEGHNTDQTHLLVTSELTWATLTTTLLILGLTLAGSIGQRMLILFRKQSELVLNRSEERFRLLVEAVKDYAIYMLDPEGHISTWNFGAQRITGYNSNEILGKHFSIFHTKKDLDISFPAEELQAAQAKGHFETEGLRVRKDGSTYWAHVVIAPLYDQEGKLTGYSKVTRNITQLKHAQMHMKKLNENLEKRVESRTLELQQREAQLRSITNALPVLIGQLDREGHFLFANEALCDWFKLPAQKIIGEKFKKILSSERYAAYAPFIEKTLAGEVTTYENTITREGQNFVLNVTLVPERNNAQNVSGFIVVATDITKHKEVEAELKKAKETAEVANMTKSAFLANMSHEIRTPLGAVLGFSELMMNPDVSAADRSNHMEIIKRNGQLLSSIINDILDLSKVEAGKLEVERVSVTFSEVLSEISSLLNLEATEKGISLQVTAEGALPAVIKTDPLRLRQILLNIVGNAIKFTRQGSVEVKIRMLEDGHGSTKLAFVVTDTGEGISPEQATRLFTPFTQADTSTTRRFGGTGLGLVLSKKLANALGGDIVLTQSTPLVGSTFTITIDPGLSQEVLFQSGQLTTQSAPLVVSEKPIELKDLNILIVDDSFENQVLIQNFLSIAGASSQSASNGLEAIEKALGGNFSLILMDL